MRNTEFSESWPGWLTKIAGSDFEHPRFLRMARRVTGRKPVITRDWSADHQYVSKSTTNEKHRVFGELAEWLKALPC